MRISDWSSDVCSSDLVRAALIERGAGDRVIALSDSARTAAEAAAALGCTVGAIVKSLVFAPGAENGERRAVMALVAGARHCAVAALGRAQIGRAACRERVCQYV